jgi:hypothetical protein
MLPAGVTNAQSCNVAGTAQGSFSGIPSGNVNLSFQCAGSITQQGPPAAAHRVPAAAAPPPPACPQFPIPCAPPFPEPRAEGSVPTWHQLVELWLHAPRSRT